MAGFERRAGPNVAYYTTFGYRLCSGRSDLRLASGAPVCPESVGPTLFRARRHLGEGCQLLPVCPEFVRPTPVLASARVGEVSKGLPTAPEDTVAFPLWRWGRVSSTLADPSAAYLAHSSKRRGWGLP